MGEKPWTPPEERPMMIDSIESFGNSVGSWVKFHFSTRKYSSDTSIEVEKLPEPMKKALLAWLTKEEL